MTDVLMSGRSGVGVGFGRAGSASFAGPGQVGRSDQPGLAVVGPGRFDPGRGSPGRRRKVSGSTSLVSTSGRDRSDLPTSSNAPVLRCGKVPGTRGAVDEQQFADADPRIKLELLAGAVSLADDLDGEVGAAELMRPAVLSRVAGEEDDDVGNAVVLRPARLHGR